MPPGGVRTHLAQRAVLELPMESQVHSTAATPHPSINAAQVLELSSAGEAELRRGVTDLSAIELELLVRLDGVAPIDDVRAAMLHVNDPAFFASLEQLQRAGLVRAKDCDPFDLQASQHLRMLGMKPADKPGSPRKGVFSVGLARRRPLRSDRSQKLCAVVVEDEPALAYFVECFLAMEGFEVRKAANRAEVIAAIRQGVPDVVLLDGTLPDVDGFQVLRSLRQNPMLRDVPTLMMTGRATREAVLDALSSGADGYLTKPVDAEMLITAVRAVVGMPDQPIDGGTAADPWVNRDGLGKRSEVAHH